MASASTSPAVLLQAGCLPAACPTLGWECPQPLSRVGAAPLHPNLQPDSPSSCLRFLTTHCFHACIYIRLS